MRTATTAAATASGWSTGKRPLPPLTAARTTSELSPHTAEEDEDKEDEDKEDEDDEDDEDEERSSEFPGGGDSSDDDHEYI